MGDANIIDMDTIRPLLFNNFKIVIICECVYVKVRGQPLRMMLSSHMCSPYLCGKELLYKKKFLTRKKLKILVRFNANTHCPFCETGLTMEPDPDIWRMGSGEAREGKVSPN